MPANHIPQQISAANVRGARVLATTAPIEATIAPANNHGTGANSPARPVARPAMSGITSQSTGARCPRLRLVMQKY
jgi:hypothetical protein